MTEQTSKEGKRLTGVIVSCSSNKTVKVVVRTLIRHPVYQKTLKRQKFYLVHDENNQGQVGQEVQIQACKPTSKRKSWELVVE